MSRRARITTSLAVAALVASTVAALSPGSATAAPVTTGRGDAAGRATLLLSQDGHGRLSISKDAHGTVTFVGVPHGVNLDNPAVTAGMSTVGAAQAHLARYGAAMGTTRPGVSLVEESVEPTVSGNDVVRFSQHVGGLPVIGGEVAVKVGPDNRLASMLATFSGATARTTTAPRALVGRATAARTARDVASLSAQGLPLTATSQGRWVFDPSLFHAPSALGTRSVWRFEVADGAGVRRMVLVDDRSGRVLLNLDLINEANRVVCDAQNIQVSTESDCTNKNANGRNEGDAASGVSDVNSAYDLAGATSDFYNQIGGIDLTQRLGIPGSGPNAGQKVLASTVRVCFTGATCPYANAFWNGRGMYYGATYAGGDDVVAHEMTHGITETSSNLMYWFQSGAINESMSDVMGEILDHRHTLEAADAEWKMGEDLPIGAIRSMKDPTIYGDPDKMTSALYTADNTGYNDNGGVHTNSGVGNKTAYLISQGGTFNGQTITGIDTGDATLTRTATLYLETIQSLTSGSEFADLARVLDQSCNDLVGTAGITAANCTNVHKATLATELRTTPTKAPQPKDAPATCPKKTKKKVLFDSEKGNAGSKLTHGKSWTRTPGTVTEPGTSTRYSIPRNAVSGGTSWFGLEQSSKRSLALVTKKGLKLPKKQKTYLWFRQWRAFQYSGINYLSGGTVEIDDVGNRAGPVSLQKKKWVNGPKQKLYSSRTKVFGGVSAGWVSSRVDISFLGGKTVKPRFTVRTLGYPGFYGWYLDDIRVYTCH
ncbi:MAG: M4 family metallopeptidase [Nocardioidaceae bacterium]|nr:M4 family metallopeptidase [Nocardioidaceae bacterium]